MKGALSGKAVAWDRAVAAGSSMPNAVRFEFVPKYCGLTWALHEEHEGSCTGILGICTGCGGAEIARLGLWATATHVKVLSRGPEA